MSTPISLELPEGTRRVTVESARGAFAALETLPVAGTPELGTALLVPGYTGSKEDFLPLLRQIAAAGHRVLAVDMRGQYQTPGPDDPAAYHPAELGLDIAAVARAAGAVHLLGHSFGGLVAREAVLHGSYTPGTLILMCSGPAALPGGPRADVLRLMLDFLAGTAPEDLGAKIAEVWHGLLEPQAIADGVAAPVVAFLQERMLANSPAGLVAMATRLLTEPDQTAELASRNIPTLVLHGADDTAWPPAQQADMARRLNARHAVIPGAAHSPAVEAPAATAGAMISFWSAAEGAGSRTEALGRT